MKQLYKKESSGSYGNFELEINVGATKLPDLNQDKILEATYQAAKLVESAIMEAVIAVDESSQLRRKEERAEILSLFKSPIHVEEIPNGYCSDWCCKHLPWFVVTTPIGRFEIGWRKRVISINWVQTIGTKTSDELFASEDVTKDKYSIHAWSIEDAQRYINTLFETSTNPHP